MANSIPPAIIVALYEAADDDRGIYPMNNIDANGLSHPRTEWQDGWNAACMAFSETREAFINWYKALPFDVASKVGDLMVADIIMPMSTKKGIEMVVNLNDVFCYAADAEAVTAEQIPSLHTIHAEHGWDGVVVWFSVNFYRGATPVKELGKSKKIKELIEELGKAKKLENKL